MTTIQEQLARIAARNGVPFKITYYCGERRKLFTRTVTIDDDLELKRKLNGCEFATIIMKDAGSADGLRRSLVMRKVNGQFVAVRGESASVPVYLFGNEYLRSRRIDPANLWDLRKESFEPLPKTEEMPA
jgi:hypothetical protein